MIYTWTWTWLAVDGSGGGTQDVSTGKWTGIEIQRRSLFPHYEAITVEERRLCCLEEVTARCKYQQVDWQRVSTTFVITMCTL